jgi:hypothetical protein
VDFVENAGDTPILMAKLQGKQRKHASPARKPNQLKKESEW